MIPLATNPPFPSVSLVVFSRRRASAAPRDVGTAGDGVGVCLGLLSQGPSPRPLFPISVKGGLARAAAAEAMAEATSLHAIRTVLEDLQDHLEFLQGAGIDGSRGMRASRARAKRLQGDDGGNGAWRLGLLYDDGGNGGLLYNHFHMLWRQRRAFHARSGGDQDNIWYIYREAPKALI